jgi:hypothetical protein
MKNARCVRKKSAVKTQARTRRDQRAATSRGRHWLGVARMKVVRIFSDRIRDRIRLEGFRSVRIRVRIFNIRYRIRIRIPKSHIYDVDNQIYPIRHDWYHTYSNSNPDKNTKINIISAIFVRIRSVFSLGVALSLSAPACNDAIPSATALPAAAPPISICLFIS